mmetsp:Transcript_1049/g.1877  ORF Transcript_1049/g.1877 Transcript_1049/m.1877 type:complete len:1050 (-) Transcript_1049:45-3194(-)
MSTQSHGHFAALFVITLLQVHTLLGLDIDFSSWLHGKLAEEIGAARRLFEASATREFDGDFEGWLSAVQIRIPDQQLPHNASAIGSLKYTVRNLTCSNVKIGTTKGSHPRQRLEGGLISNINGFGSLTIDLQRIAIDCTAHLDYGAQDWADIALHTVDGLFHLTTVLGTKDFSKLKFPDWLIFQGCKLKPSFTVSTPAGSPHTQLLAPMIDGLLPPLLDETLNNLFCNELLPKARTKLESLLLTMHSYGKLGLEKPDPDSFPSWDPSLVSWDEVPAIHWIERFQEILPYPAGGFSEILHSIFKSNRACLMQPFDEFVDRNDTDICFTNGVKCIVGDADKKGCMAPHPESLPDAFHVDFTSFNVKVTTPNVTFVKGHKTTLNSHFRDNRTTLSAALNISFAGAAGGAEIRDTWGQLGVDLVLEDIELASLFHAAFDRNTFSAIPTVNYAYPPCLKAAYRKIKLADLTAKFNAKVPTVTFTQVPQYASPFLLEIADFFQNFLRLGWQYDKAFPAMMRGYLLNNTEESIHDYWDKLRPQDCPLLWGLEPDPTVHFPLINPPLGSTLNWIAAGVVVLGFVLTCLLFFLQRSLEKGGHFEDSEELTPETSLSPSESEYLTASDVTDSGAEDNSCGSSALFMSGAVPWAVAGAVPFSILACVFLLAGSNCLYFAITVFNLELGAEGTAVYELMAYNIFFSIKMLREHGFPILSFVLFLFSGVLPYGKLIAMLLMWVLPTSCVSRSCRGRVLYFVDQIGKYSLVDIFVLQFIICCLYTNMPIPHVEDGGMDLSVSLRTPEQNGFFAFVMATVASLVIGHVCLYYHHQDPAVKSEHYAQSREMLARKNSSPKDFRRRRWWIGPIMVLLLVVILICYILPAFSVKLQAAEHMVLHDATYSMVGFVSNMLSFQQHPHFVTVFGQVTFVTFALSTIVLHTCILLIVWYFRVPQKWLEIFRTMAHVLNAWAALDVMTISMALTLMEMDISDFHHLDANGRVMASKVLGMDVTDPRGIKIGVTLEYSFYIMAGAVVVHFVIGRMVMGMMEEAVEGQIDIHDA